EVDASVRPKPPGFEVDGAADSVQGPWVPVEIPWPHRNALEPGCRNHHLVPPFDRFRGTRPGSQRLAAHGIRLVCGLNIQAPNRLLGQPLDRRRVVDHPVPAAPYEPSFPSLAVPE